MEKHKNFSDAAALRKKAEELLKNKPLKHDSQLSEAENLRLIYELQVHQIELELQNEELCHARAMAEVESDKYTRLYDMAPSGYFTLSCKGEIVELNLNGALMLGEDRSQLINKHFHCFVSKDTQEVFKQFLGNSLKNNTQASCEVDLVTYGKQSLFAHLSGKATENGKHCMVTAVDITDRKNAELRHRKETELNSSLLGLNTNAPILTDKELYDQALQIAVNITDSKTGFLFQISDNQREIIPITRNDEIKKNRSALFENKNLPDKSGIWADCLRQKKAIICNDYPGLPNKNGLSAVHASYVRTLCVPVVDNEVVRFIMGVVSKPSDYTEMNKIQIQAVANDLHKKLEKRKVEKHLQKNEERWQFAIEGSNDGIWDWNVLTDEVFFSNRWKEMIGYGPDELEGKLSEWQTRVHPDDINAVMFRLHEHFEKKTPVYTAEHRLRCKDGSWVWILDRGKVLEWTPDGKPSRMVGTHSNITEQKTAIEEIRWLNDDMQLMNAVTQASNHDESLDSILNIISGLLCKSFNSHSLSIHLPDEHTGEYIMHSNTLDNALIKKIYKLTGREIPQIRLKINSEHPFSEIERNGKGLLVTGKQAIVNRLSGYLKGTNWPALVQTLIKKMLPAICNILEYQSAVAVPMIANGKTIGFLELGSRNIMTDHDLSRIQSIAGHFATAIVRSESKKKLRESEERYRSIFESVQEVYFEVSMDGTLLEVSPSVEQISKGYFSRDEMLGKSFADVYAYPGERNIYFSKLLQQKRVNDYKLWLRNKDGSIFPVAVSSALSYDDNGKPLKITGILRDITERHKAEHVLKTSEEKYRSDLIFLQSILESPISVIIFSLDKKYCYTKFSLSHKETMKKIWGIDIQIGMNMLDLIPDMADREKTKRNFDRALTGDFFVVEEEYGDKELARIFYDDYYSPVKDAEGNIAGISVFILDVSQRRLAELQIVELNTNLEQTVIARTEQIKEALSRLEKIADRVPGVVYQYRLNPDGSSCFPYASEGIRDIYRVSPEEVADDASAVFANIHPDDIDGVVASMQDSARSLSLWQHNYRVKFADGTIRWLAGNAMPNQLADGSVLWHGFISDKTEREEAENSLRRSEAEKAAIIRAVPDLMFRIRRDGTYLDYMSTDQNMLFLPREQFIGKTISQVLPPDLALQSMAAIEKAFHHEEIAGYEYSLTVNGKLRYFENRIIVASADEVLSIIRDITYRKESEVALAMQSAAFESFALAIIITDINGIIQWANTAFTGLTGYPADEVIGKTPGALVKSGKQKKDFYKRFWDTLLNKEVWTGELINRRKDGSLYHEEQTITPVLDSKGNISSFISIKIDITERKTLFLQLADQKRRLVDILKGTKAGTWEWNVQTGETIFNEQWAEMLGYTLEEISPVSIETWMKFAHPDDLKASDELLEKHFKGELDYYTFESRMKHKSGEWIWVLDRGRVHEWDKEGMPLLMSGTHQDITEQKRIEHALIVAKNEAEKANQAKSEFLSRMSHELRTPMNSILGFAQLLEIGDLNVSQKRGVNHILNSGKHLLNLINEVLDISGIEAGRVSLSLVPVQLGRMIGEAIDTVDPAARAMQVKFELIDADHDPLFVKSDPHRLRQVLLNLISNAVKYNVNGGTVTIKTELRTAIAPAMPFVRISVSDTGHGIQPEFIKKIFNPFERIGAEKTGIEGTGLGLMVVKKLMEAMGGRVGVESVPGEGSTFWIELPHIATLEKEARQTEPGSLTPALINEKSGTILYIEDNASNTELVEQILLDQRPSIQFINSTLGAQTVPLAIEYAPDLILLDLDLPDIQGIEVIRLLQAEEKTMAIPVVIVSADAMAHQIEKLMNAGAKDYLTKPLDISVFLQVVDEYAGSAK